MQTPHRLAVKIVTPHAANYLLSLPADYETTRQRWPLILFLHGSGERGNNVHWVARQGLPKLLKRTNYLPFVVVSPQCPAGESWSNATLQVLLQEVVKNYRVDKNRVYLTGLSMGGYGAWALALERPELFAAVAPICGGGSIITPLLEDRTKVSDLKKLPVWAFHGAKDKVVKLEESERMVAALRKIGCQNVRLTVYPDADHDSWTETYNNPRLYEWFLSHKRSK